MRFDQHGLRLSCEKMIRLVNSTQLAEMRREVERLVERQVKARDKSLVDIHPSVHGSDDEAVGAHEAVVVRQWSGGLERDRPIVETRSTQTIAGDKRDLLRVATEEASLAYDEVSDEDSPTSSKKARDSDSYNTVNYGGAVVDTYVDQQLEIVEAERLRREQEQQHQQQQHRGQSPSGGVELDHGGALGGHQRSQPPSSLERTGGDAEAKVTTTEESQESDEDEDDGVDESDGHAGVENANTSKPGTVRQGAAATEILSDGERVCGQAVVVEQVPIVAREVTI